MKNILLILFFCVGFNVNSQVPDLLLASKQQSAVPADPILSIPNITAYWKREGIDASAIATNDDVDTWTDLVGGKVLAKIGTTQPKLNLSGSKREVKFNGNSGMSVPEWAGVDFAGQVDSYTIVVKVGNILGTGTLIGKQTNGDSNIQYQIAYRNSGTGEVGQNIGSLNNTTGYNSYFTKPLTAAGSLSANKVISLAVGTADNFDSVLYYDNEVLYEESTAHTLNERVGPETNNHPFSVGARRNNSDTEVGYVFTGSISHVIVFARKLTSLEIATIVANLD